MNILLETTTGQPTPAGIAPQIIRGPQQIVLGFPTNGVIGPISGGASTISLQFFKPSALGTVLATFDTWLLDLSGNYYVAAVDPSSAANMAWLQDQVLLAQVTYGAGATQSIKFMVNFGGPGSQNATPRPPAYILQTAGAGIYPQDIGRFVGDLVLTQTEGYFKAKAAASVLGFQLHAQTAPTGASVLVQAVKNGAAVAGAIATLTNGQKSQETTFGSAITLAIGDTLQFVITQIGSTTPGSELDVRAILQAAAS